MKTTRKNLLLLAFAAGALFVIGLNVMANPPAEELPPVDIICTQHPGPMAQCWVYDDDYPDGPCRWTGNQFNFCIDTGNSN